MKKSPCMNCCDRQVGCHSSCKDYIEFKINVDKESQARIDFLKNFNEHLSYMKDQKTKRIRAHR